MIVRGQRARGRLSFRLFLAATLTGLAGCAIPALPSDGAATPSATPTPAPRDSIEAVCRSSIEAMTQLDRQLDEVTNGANIQQHGTTAATVTGVLAADLQQIQTLTVATADPELLNVWLGQLQSAIDRGVHAVEASAAKDVPAFTVALEGMREERAAAQTTARLLGYESCPY